MNLLDETRENITKSGHAPSDIVLIGSLESGYRCSWDEFKVMADEDYDSGFGAAQVATDLKIVFTDGQTMWRGEYDGSEWWEFSVPAIIPTEQKSIVGLFANSKNVGWVSLEEIAEPTS